MALKAGSKDAAGKLPGPLVKMPVDGLQVGRDDGGRVGEYPDAFPFTGKIRRVTVQLTP